MKFLTKNMAGAKIVEILLVIAVAGSSILLSSSLLNSAREKGRDTQRVSEINKIQSALEMYYLDRAGYPEGIDVTLGEGNGVCLNYSGWDVLGCEDSYIDSIMPDPDLEGTGYVYSDNGRYDYEIVFELENGVNGLPAGSCQAIPGPKINCI